MRKLGEREGVSPRNGNAWKQAEFLLEIPGNYPKHINFAVRDGQQNRIKHFESMIGKTVKVSFDIDAHEYQGRWFNDIDAWGVMEYVVGQGVQPSTTQASSGNSDLPFDRP